MFRSYLLCRNKRYRKLLFKKLPFGDNGQHSKTCKQKEVGNIRIQEGRQVVIVHKKMQHQQSREHDNSYFFVKEHQHKPNHHECIY